MRNFLLGFHIAISVLLVVVILFQQKGTGLGSAFGGQSALYRSRRGAEKFLFGATIVLAVLFVGGAFTILKFIS